MHVQSLNCIWCLKNNLPKTYEETSIFAAKYNLSSTGNFLSLNHLFLCRGIPLFISPGHSTSWTQVDICCSKLKLSLPIFTGIHVRRSDISSLLVHVIYVCIVIVKILLLVTPAADVIHLSTWQCNCIVKVAEWRT